MPKKKPGREGSGPVEFMPARECRQSPSRGESLSARAAIWEDSKTAASSMFKLSVQAGSGTTRMHVDQPCISRKTICHAHAASLCMLAQSHDEIGSRPEFPEALQCDGGVEADRLRIPSRR
jgi:hypothetical protein